MIAFGGKKVLVMGLGLLGGGAATAKWLVCHGARVTVTDLKTRKELTPSIKALGPAAKEIRFVLGKHHALDFKKNEIIVVNPGVPRESTYLKAAKRAGAQLENEASIFFRFCKNPIIGVTGTRGKTTVVNWIYQILKNKYRKTVLTGNSSDNPMLNVLDKLDGRSPVVVELSSWHLEILPKSKKAPHIAVITNLYPDHLNRYRGMLSYASAKANIFKNQANRDFLILNKKNKWTGFFSRLKPKSKILYFPFKPNKELLNFRSKYGEHNLENLEAAILAAKCAGAPISLIRKAIKKLKPVKFREEVVGRSKNLIVVNDTTATTPEATVAALHRFSRHGEIILITGGTDKKLDFDGWAREVKRRVRPDSLYLLDGSATGKMLKSLGKMRFFGQYKPNLFNSLQGIVRKIKRDLRAWQGKPPPVILFSPSSASFEKFKNEFDRGEKFGLYWRTVR